MSGRLLTFSQYLGGSDQVKVEEMFPSTQKTFTYNYGFDVSNYDFHADMQSVVVDAMTYNTADGQPNFTTSAIIGSFANAEIGNANIVTTSAASGTINFTIPKNRYTGPLLPDSRTNVVISVVSFRWTDKNVTPNTTDGHRWAIIERFEPDVVIGNPTLAVGYTAIPTS